MIDWKQVDGLREDLGDGFDELVELFLAEVEEVRARLTPGIPPAQMAADLHFLKGAALNLGFADLAALCSAGEVQAAGGGEVDPAPILTCLATSREVFMQGLARRRVA
jgi:histidine phosphotransfer protein HptB